MCRAPHIQALSTHAVMLLLLKNRQFRLSAMSHILAARDAEPDIVNQERSCPFSEHTAEPQMNKILLEKTQGTVLHKGHYVRVAAVMRIVGDWDCS